MDAEAEQDTTWRLLYAKLTGLLESVGESSAVGEGDYWLVDDNRSTKQHKLYVFRIEFITSTLIDEFQKVLRLVEPGWELLIALDLKDKRYTGGPEGLIVTSAEVREHWNRQLLKEQLGL
jgi:hypothetical protein